MRFSQFIKKLSSAVQNWMKKVSIKKLLLLGFLAILFTANGAFWYIRLSKGPAQQPERYESRTELKEWELNLDEVNVPESGSEGKDGKTQESLSEGEQLEEILNEEKESAEAEEASDEIEEAIPTFAESPATMALPVVGKTITDHSTDELVYSKTLEQWCVHKGVDIAADEGTQVKAALSGTVVEVRKSDPRLGVVVVLDHGNGLRTLYGNLMSDNLVHKGKQVKKGDVIGGVGKTAPFEIEDPPHLHFEVLKGNESIDPKGFLPDL